MSLLALSLRRLGGGFLRNRLRIVLLCAGLAVGQPAGAQFPSPPASFAQPLPAAPLEPYGVSAPVRLPSVNPAEIAAVYQADPRQAAPILFMGFNQSNFVRQPVLRTLEDDATDQPLLRRPGNCISATKSRPNLPPG